ncbi:kin of IRRE-like protein 1 [Saccostrea echinata]|uniref:kin of IRRE-like protein 1 n=1 Tax=Saccostrea echinata TaxID=191078 RepID=UPI002A80445C|nr:kin of IRRE-like protein 1 [Saccostrea echinata]XP_061188975.1 kin of IRRE-like protein 1 [Saccostrea echinata]XP_061188976.1 kin of IRRE-like protein 1 [Saccostrea echinata]XP_061188977.1 kin of IRRE-like protein 1 [Saccostrea echinata]XP_061188978.1 kin of IRRE-like protein 1 [Saccostrea echinata]
MASITPYIHSFITVFLIHKVFGGQELVEGPVSQKARIGMKIQLKCVVKNRSGIVQWTQNGFGMGNNRDLPPYPRYRMVGGTSTVNNDVIEEFTLEITDVQLEDDGKYNCQVTPTDDDPRVLLSDEVTVTVLAPPDQPVIDGGPVIPLELGVPTNITCRANGGKPAPQVLWYKEGSGRITNNTYTIGTPNKVTKVTDVIGIVTLKATNEDHEKKIECHAKNEALRQPLISSVTLNVQYKPKINISHNVTRPLKENDYVRFSCDGDANPREVQWRWMRDGRLIRGQTRRNLDIPHISSEYHQSTISCEATNSIGSSTAKMKLDILYEPKFIGVNQYIPVDLKKSVTLTCNATGNPQPEIRWRRSDSQIPLSETTTLTVSNIGEEDLGMYICEASALYGAFSTKKIDVYLLLKGPPEIKSKSTQYAEPDLDGKVSCLVRSVPYPDQILWIRGDKIIDYAQSGRYSVTQTQMADGVENILHITHLTPSDFGDYICTAFNGYGNDTMKITLAETESLHLSYIIGAVCGGVAVLLFIAGVCILYHRCKSSDNESYAETDSHTEFKKREKSDSPSDFTKSTLMDEWRQNLNYHCPTDYDDINNINNVYNDPRINSSGYGTLKSDQIINGYENHNGHLFSDYTHRSDESFPVENVNGYNSNNYGTSTFRSGSRTDFMKPDYSSDPYRLPPANLSTTQLATNV